MHRGVERRPGGDRFEAGLPAQHGGERLPGVRDRDTGTIAAPPAGTVTTGAPSGPGTATSSRSRSCRVRGQHAVVRDDGPSAVADDAGLVELDQANGAGLQGLDGEGLDGFHAAERRTAHDPTVGGTTSETPQAGLDSGVLAGRPSARAAKQALAVRSTRRMSGPMSRPSTGASGPVISMVRLFRLPAALGLDPWVPTKVVLRRSKAELVARLEPGHQPDRLALPRLLDPCTGPEPQRAVLETLQ